MPKRDKPGAWQGGGSTPPQEEPSHPLGPETPTRFLEPDFAITGAVGYDASVEDSDIFQLRTDTPIAPKLVPPQQAFHSTELDPHQDPREVPTHLQILPLTTEQQETITEKEHEPTDIFLAEKFVVPVLNQPSEHWDIFTWVLPGPDAPQPMRIADRQARRKNVLLVNVGTVTISIGPTAQNVTPFLLVGAALKLETMAPIYATSAAGGLLTVIEELDD
jgi:hypothetical protein